MENNTISGGNSKIDTSLEAPQRVAVTSSVMISRETMVKNRRGEGGDSRAFCLWAANSRLVAAPTRVCCTKIGGFSSYK